MATMRTTQKRRKETSKTMLMSRNKKTTNLRWRQRLSRAQNQRVLQQKPKTRSTKLRLDSSGDENIVRLTIFGYPSLNVVSWNLFMDFDHWPVLISFVVTCWHELHIAKRCEEVRIIAQWLQSSSWSSKIGEHIEPQITIIMLVRSTISIRDSDLETCIPAPDVVSHGLLLIIGLLISNT